jgi:hypothetical protein
VGEQPGGLVSRFNVISPEGLQVPGEGEFQPGKGEMTMRHFKSVFVGATAAVLLLASGCESRQNRDVENQRGTGGAGLNSNDSASDLRHDQIGTSDSMKNTDSASGVTGADGRPVQQDEQGTGGSGNLQGNSSEELGTGSTNSNQLGGTTATGTQESDMGNGGATNSGQNQDSTTR